MEKTIEANAQTIVPAETKEPVVVQDLTPQAPDNEARVAALEAEKNRLTEEAANYKLAYLKEKNKKTPENTDESEDDKMRRIAAETLANSRIAEITREQDTIIKQALKENKELKLAQMNKTGVPTVMGSHTEGKTVSDTLVTPEQLAAFKARGWSDKDVERYKKNLLKNTR